MMLWETCIVILVATICIAALSRIITKDINWYKSKRAADYEIVFQDIAKAWAQIIEGIVTPKTKE